MPRHSFCWITPALATPIVNTSNDLKMSSDLSGFERYHEPLSTPPCILFLNGFPGVGKLIIAKALSAKLKQTRQYTSSPHRQPPSRRPSCCHRANPKYCSLRIAKSVPQDNYRGIKGLGGRTTLCHLHSSLGNIGFVNAVR
jgi:hypothetical protein